MAKITMGIGSSHSPALLMRPDAWLERARIDDTSIHALFDETGTRVTYDELAGTRGDTLLKEIAPDVLQGRFEANERAIAEVARRLKAADPDIVIMIGDDHKEVFDEDNMPALSVYWGETLPYRPQGIMKWKYDAALMPEFWYPQEPADHPVPSEFEVRLIGDLMNDGFDPAHSKYYPEKQGMSHSFGYIYNRIMTDKVWPAIPVSINTYYPPNQITPARAYQLGQAIRKAVESWPEDLEVAIIATGGLSHFVVDEEFDKAFLAMLEKGGVEGHVALPLEKMQSGSSEFRCWTTLAGAVDGMTYDLIDYVPCYRSPAGTGCAMAFVTWS
jgi:3-O-methylgallate 3,4-dioxygenase